MASALSIPMQLGAADAEVGWCRMVAGSCTVAAVEVVTCHSRAVVLLGCGSRKSISLSLLFPALF